MKNTVINGKFVLALAICMAAQFGSNPASYGTGLNPVPDPVDFGADVGFVWTDQSPGELTDRMDRFQNDKMVTIRYFIDSFEPDGSQLPVPPEDALDAFCSDASSRGLKVIPVFYAHTYYATNTHDEGNYAADVIAVLEDVVSYIPGTIIGVYLGNEDDAFNDALTEPKWNEGSGSISFNSFVQAGRNFAEYYYAAADAIRSHANSNINSVTIYSYGIEKQATLSLTFDDNTGAAFLHGFLDELSNLHPANQSRHPDVLTIHGYTETGKYQPEEVVNTSTGATGWIDRLTWLRALAIAHDDYLPRFANTEYGFSPISGKTYAVADSGMTPDTEGPNDKTQAIYYLRRILMDATMVSSSGTSWWDKNLYWQHCFNDEGDSRFWTGWFTSQFASKKIRTVAQEVFSTNANRPGLSGDYVTWKKLESLGTSPSSERLMTCMWITEDNVKWGAIWRYEPTPPSARIQRFWAPSATTKTFRFFQGSSPGDATPYKFDFSGTTPDFEELTPISPSHDGGQGWTYTLSNLVDTNPLFLKFED